MAGFGGFCPLPLRLGGSAIEGWTPQQHARACADMAAMVRAKPFAILTYDFDVALDPRVLAYHAQHGAGIYAAPTLTKNGVGDVTIEWLAAYTDDYAQTQPTAITQAKLSVSLAAAAVIWPCYRVTSPSTVRVYTKRFDGTAVDAMVTVAVK